MDENAMKKIPILQCVSGRIFGYGWDADTETLAVQFKDREGKPATIYHYAGVTRPVFHDLECAESKGKFFGTVIQSRDEDGRLNYPYSKYVEAKADE